MSVNQRYFHLPFGDQFEKLSWVRGGGGFSMISISLSRLCYERESRVISTCRSVFNLKSLFEFSRLFFGVIYIDNTDDQKKLSTSNEHFELKTER